MVVFLAQFMIVLLAPAQDTQGRGFVPCHQKMAEEVYDCDGKVLCVLGGVLENTRCNSGVIADGFLMWIKGKQKTPWDSYFFLQQQPKLQEKDEALQEFYEKNPNLKQEMNELKQLNQKLERQVPEVEAVPEVEGVPEIEGVLEVEAVLEQKDDDKVEIEDDK